MKKNELVAAIAAKENCTKKDADKAVTALIDVIIDEVKGISVDFDTDKTYVDAITDALVAGEKVSITGFGTFEVRERASKKCINPHTREEMTTKPCKVLAFKAGKTMKDAINPEK